VYDFYFNEEEPLKCEICMKAIDGDYAIKLGKTDYVHLFCSKECLIEFLRRLKANKNE